ncbi:MAG: hypothetical protein BWY09_01051 [Candidatus Hydrogenedentes bacterium ADurb.Bin179]|nr:MAG: hypothetical protein BWY09_01051 [Candidatus Hydrogenedentes bacterium ADurb.Bin179]
MDMAVKFFVVNCGQAAATGTQMGMIVGSIKQVVNTFFIRHNTEKSTHGILLSQERFYPEVYP